MGKKRKAESEKAETKTWSGESCISASPRFRFLAFRFLPGCTKLAFEARRA
jgi:hypothetical protein